MALTKYGLERYLGRSMTKADEKNITKNFRKLTKSITKPEPNEDEIIAPQTDRREVARKIFVGAVVVVGVAVFTSAVARHAVRKELQIPR